MGGIKKSYLIPWQNLFNLSEAQLCVANKVVSEELFMNRITTSTKSILCADKKVFDSLMLYANDISLPMVSASAIIKDAIERSVHIVLSKAYESLHWNVVSKHSDLVAPIKRMLKDIARLNILLASKFPLTGSQQIKLSISKKNNFQVEYNKIYRAFLENCMSDGEYSCSDEEYAHELCFILGIEKDKYIEILSDVLQKTYRQVLCKKFTSGLLESSKSKASLLNNLCLSLNFSHEKAKEVNYSIFQTRLKQLVVKKKITKVEEDELETLRLQLCIEEHQARKFKKDILGRPYKQAIHEAFRAGLRSSNILDKANVRKRKFELRIEDSIAKEIINSEIKKFLIAFVATSQTKSTPMEAAKEIKNMLLFLNFVAGPLLKDAIGKKGRKVFSGSNMKSLAEKAEKNNRNSKNCDTVKFPTSSTYDSNMISKDAKLKIYQKFYKEITLSTDLELKQRINVYENFIKYYLSCEIMQSGSVSLSVENENNFIFIKQLEDIFKLNRDDIKIAYQSITKQAFKNQVKEIFKDGHIIVEKQHYVTKLQKKMSLNDTFVERTVKETLKHLKGREETVLDSLLALSEKSEKNALVTNKTVALQMFRAELEKAINSGTETFDRHKYLVTYPNVLNLDGKKVNSLIQEIVDDKMKNTLVQVISYYRQNKVFEMVKTIETLVYQYRVFPQKVKWDDKYEVNNAYTLFMSHSKSHELFKEAAEALGISHDEILKLKNTTNTRNVEESKRIIENKWSYFELN